MLNDTHGRNLEKSHHPSVYSTSFLTQSDQLQAATENMEELQIGGSESDSSADDDTVSTHHPTGTSDSEYPLRDP